MTAGVRARRRPSRLAGRGRRPAGAADPGSGARKPAGVGPLRRSPSASISLTTTRSPALRPSPETSISAPSSSPVVTATGRSLPSASSTQTWLACVRRASAVALRRPLPARLAVRGRCSGSRPRPRRPRRRPGLSDRFLARLLALARRLRPASSRGAGVADSSAANPSGSEAHGRQRNAQDVVVLVDDDVRVGGHAGEEQAVRIVDGDDDVVGDDVLHRDRPVPDLRDLAAERLPGNAWTVKKASCPTRTSPTSASLTLVSTCIFVRSLPMRKSVGLWRLAATVWPTSIERVITVPTTGETMFV